MSNNKEIIFDSYKSEKFLSKYITVSNSQLVTKAEQIKIKPPLALKLISQQALHKTDIGGVKFIHHPSEIQDSFDDLVSIGKKRRIKVDGIMVQQFEEGEQLIIGIKKDPVFNHVLLFGLGGVFTEVLDDTSIRKCPINKHDADEMIFDLRASKIFHGFRGKKLNVPLLKKSLIKISELPQKHKKIKELDINPFILQEKKGVVVDARIVFEK